MREDADAIARALIHQVAIAVPKGAGKSEQNVRTWISRQMWTKWCEFTGDDPRSLPTAWSSGKECRRVYGSETIIVNKPGMWAASKPIK